MSNLARGNAAIEYARVLYDGGWHKSRALCVEREYDGETETARYPYSRVRFVKTYDAMAAITRGEWIETGLVAETW